MWQRWQQRPNKRSGWRNHRRRPGAVAARYSWAAPTKVDPVIRGRVLMRTRTIGAAHKTAGSIVRNRRRRAVRRRRPPPPVDHWPSTLAHRQDVGRASLPNHLGSRVPGSHYRCRILTLRTMMSVLLSTASRDRHGILVTAVLVAAIIAGPPACSATIDPIPTASNGRDAGIL